MERIEGMENKQETLFESLLAALWENAQAPAAQGVQDALKAVGFDAAGRIDAVGSLMYEMGDGDRTLVLAAPLDVPVLTVCAVCEDGRIRVSAPPSLDLVPLAYSRVALSGGHKGVLVPETADVACPNCVDVGAKDKQEAIKLAQPGDTIVFCSAPVALQNSITCGFGAAQRAIAASLAAFAAQVEEKNGVPAGWKVIAAFCAQDALGGRGAKALSEVLQPDAAITLRPFPAESSAGSTPLALGAGPVVCAKAKSFLSAPKLIDALEAAANKEGIGVQRCVTAQGEPAAAALQAAGGGALACAVGLPVKNCFTGGERISNADAKALGALLLSLVSQHTALWTE